VNKMVLGFDKKLVGSEGVGVENRGGKGMKLI
jgi:hypothetical protein